MAYIDATSGDYPPTGFLFGVINTTTHEFVKVLPLNEIPGPMALDRATGDVYIAGNDSIRVFHGGNQSMGRRIGVGHLIVSVAYDRDVSDYIFVTSGNRVYAVDPQTDRVVGNATVGNGANGMALDPVSRRLYVAEYPDSEIFVFDAQSLSPVGIIALPACCAAQLAVDFKTHRLFATTSTKFVDVVSTQTDTFVNRVAVASSDQNSTNLVAVDPGGGRVFVASSPGGSIVELDGWGSAVTGRFRATSQIAGMSIDETAHELYLTNYHQVTVLGVSAVDIGSLLAGIGGVAALTVGVVALLAALRRKTRSQWQRSLARGH